MRADVDSVTNQDMCEPKRGRELTKLLQCWLSIYCTCRRR